MGKRILKIDLEMAEKIEVKDGNPNFNFFVTVKNIFFIKGAISCLRNTNSNIINNAVNRPGFHKRLSAHPQPVPIGLNMF